MRGTYIRYDAKDTVESRRSIDVRELRKGGYLEPGLCSTWAWTYLDGSTNSVSIRAEVGRVVLQYRTKTWYEADWLDRNEPVALDWSPCYFGGQRSWFICPGRSCGRRVAKLHFGGSGYLCRHCHKLNYKSTRENEASMAMSRASAIRIKLGGTGSLMAPFPEKPKFMWQRTYNKMAGEALRDSSFGFERMAEQREKLENILDRMASDR